MLSARALGYPGLDTYLAAHPNIPAKRLATVLGVSHSSITRWRASNCAGPGLATLEGPGAHGGKAPGPGHHRSAGAPGREGERANRPGPQGPRGGVRRVDASPLETALAGEHAAFGAAVATLRGALHELDEALAATATREPADRQPGLTATSFQTVTDTPRLSAVR